VNSARQNLAVILREGLSLLSRSGNDFGYFSWDGFEDARREIALIVAELEAGGLPEKMDLKVLLAPTGDVQEVSLSSGWGQEFLTLASRFDAALEQAYS
jgi:hypothetical protein